MNALMRGHLTDEFGESQVLDNESIRPHRKDGLQKFYRLRKFFLENNHVKGQVHPHTIEMAEVYHLFEVFQRKIRRSSTSVKKRNSDINSISTIMDGRKTHVHVPNRK